MKKTIIDKLRIFLRIIFRKLVLMNDTPFRIAFGFSIGAFMGILPGTGPVAALALAALFRMNKAAAFLGGLLTNTWLSWVTLLFAIKTGALIYGIQWQDLYKIWENILKNFHWNQLLSAGIWSFLLPVATGFLILSLLFGLAVFLVSLAILTIFHNYRRKKEALKKAQLPSDLRK